MNTVHPRASLLQASSVGKGEWIVGCCLPLSLFFILKGGKERARSDARPPFAGQGPSWGETQASDFYFLINYCSVLWFVGGIGVNESRSIHFLGAPQHQHEQCCGVHRVVLGEGSCRRRMQLSAVIVAAVVVVVLAVVVVHCPAWKELVLSVLLLQTGSRHGHCLLGCRPLPSHRRPSAFGSVDSAQVTMEWFPLFFLGVIVLDTTAGRAVLDPNLSISPLIAVSEGSSRQTLVWLS